MLINPTTVIDGNPVNLATLLEKKHLIPDYQRDYVWKEKTIRQLWDDLLSHYNENNAHDEPKTGIMGYFMGAMVFISRHRDAVNEVIDGQQRLTSLSCLAAALKAHCSVVLLASRILEIHPISRSL